MQIQANLAMDGHLPFTHQEDRFTHFSHESRSAGSSFTAHIKITLTEPSMNLKYKINQSPNLIYDCLSDMTTFVSLHPVITKMRKKDTHTYKVYETIRVGFLPLSFTYAATIYGSREKGHIRMQARVMGMTEVDMAFDIQEVLGGSIVFEEIQVKSFLPVKSQLEKLFRDQHALLFENISKLDRVQSVENAI